MASLCQLTIAEAATQIRKGALSPVELTRAHLERIRLLDPALNSYITVTAEIAIRQAEEAAAEIAAGRNRGPLHGIPISIKDIVATSGVPTTGGSKSLADWVPKADAHVVTRMRQAGAVMLGKATTFEFAWAGTSQQDYVKPARNPWNSKFPAGGSSNGSAAGVAAGLAMGSIASDSGGSIRNPAHLCGLTGLKPTYGLVGRTGVLPLSYSFDTVGPLARCAEDAAILLQGMAGPDASDPASVNQPIPDYHGELRRRPRNYRIGILPGYMAAVGMDAEAYAGFNEAIRVFRSIGATVREVAIPYLEYSAATTWTILRIEGFDVHRERMRTERARLGSNFLRTTLPGGYLSAEDYMRAQKARRLISAMIAKAFREVDLLLMPTNPQPGSGAHYEAEPRNARIAKSGVAYVTPFNVNGSPAISIPCMFTKLGAPAGLQIAARPFEDGLVLAAAHHYQSETNWHRRFPAL